MDWHSIAYSVGISVTVSVFLFSWLRKDISGLKTEIGSIRTEIGSLRESTDRKIDDIRDLFIKYIAKDKEET